MVAGFIALLNVAVTTGVLGQTRVEPAGGVTAVTIGGFRGPVATVAACLSGSPHPANRATSRNAVIQVLLTFNLRIGFSSTPAFLQSVPATLNRLKSTIRDFAGLSNNGHLRMRAPAHLPSAVYAMWGCRQQWQSAKTRRGRAISFRDSCKAVAPLFWQNGAGVLE